MIIFIHGFGSNGLGDKATKLKEYFKKDEIPFIAPSLSYIPELAIQTLEELIESYDDVTLIGSSLGGYYALYLSEKYNIKTVLINPAMHPYSSLKRAIGMSTSYYDESKFTWQNSHLKMLEKYKVENINQKNKFLLVQKGDTVLYYIEAVEKMPAAKSVIEENGSHSFDGLERYFEDIEDFLIG